MRDDRIDGPCWWRTATRSGNDAVPALLDGKVQLGISGHTLAISSKRGRFGPPSHGRMPTSVQAG